MLVTQHFSLKVTPSEVTKTIVSISKKVAKKAVDRNLIRRRVKPVLKKLTSNLPPAIYLIVVKSGSHTLRGKILEDELASLFKKS